ncbi:pentatricopeptide repeat-containing protein At4g14050, mitochondrial [Oryza brachyantha]|nr:pentatricopeptide repeat-containing protein At4g14050, mitochondrial [Oryza brachyantha]XP_040379719.1 pentatricopeptide repeat-containing protein At4g14050, mitochondrial [Oryza brachyantha]XP_040379720.1 pentatricopeptide repeat-containing protein At4g14050, mitochondrial [Oryza brachyantha]
MLSPAAAAAVRAAAGSPAAVRGAHARLLKKGLAHQRPAPEALVSAYAKSRLLPDALHLFDETPRRNIYFYSSLLAAVAQSESPALAVPILRRMISADALRPDHFVLASVASASARLRSLRLGRQLHGQFVASPYSGDDVVKSSLVDMYCKCGILDDARKVFDSMGAKNTVVWTALVSGYASNGCSDEALQLFWSMPVRNLVAWTALISGLVKTGESVSAVELFVEMRRDDVGIDDAFVMSIVIAGAADLAAFVLGRQLHCSAMRLGFLSSTIVGNALVDMYSKCSDIHSAREVFKGITFHDMIAWTTMVVGEAQHGHAKEALALYDRMVIAGVKPNEVTFVGLIYACSHAGLVQKGREFFESMKRDYGIDPGLQHYTCYLDLLSRSGHLLEAEELITTMPYKPDEAAWGALLSACKKYNDAEMCIRVADKLLELGPKDSSTYILLSNVYAVNRKWDSVAKLRKCMTGLNIRKDPGYSWIEAGREFRLFHAGEVPFDVREEIMGFLDEMVLEMRRRGYVPDTSSVMHDLEENEKELHLFLHSERLAVAFGLIKSLPGSVIRVVKNLRVCVDCHTVMKLISEITQRKIVVRDSSRFHHFKGGKCSCSEFW